MAHCVLHSVQVIVAPYNQPYMQIRARLCTDSSMPFVSWVKQYYNVCDYFFLNFFMWKVEPTTLNMQKYGIHIFDFEGHVYEELVCGAEFV
jgi:hypothetical protein